LALKTKQLVMLTGLFLLMALLFKGELNSVRAQSEYKLYLPLVFKGEPVRLDTFERANLNWTILNMKGPGDTSQTFFTIRNGRLYSKILDNSDRWIIHPGWRPLGDFQLEVDARFLWEYNPNNMPPQTFSGLGLVWGGNDTWSQGYGYHIGFGGYQFTWAIARYDGPSAFTYLANWGGAPDFVHNWDNWNHLSIVRIRDYIYVYCNGYPMPLPPPYYNYLVDGTYGTNRLVGLTVTSWEWSQDEIEFDNFKLTPLSMPY